jgi:hypothetical protein
MNSSEFHHAYDDVEAGPEAVDMAPDVEGPKSINSDDESDALIAILTKKRSCDSKADTPARERKMPVTQEGFVLKKRLRDRPRPSERTNMLDFSFENPLDGKFKDINCVKRLIEDYPADVHVAPTSYCHYGYCYRKRTVFISTLRGFTPKAPCPSHACAAQRYSGTHTGTVVECDVAQKNSIPPLLVDLMIGAWTAAYKHTASHFLVVDVFSGWGSVASRVAERWPCVRLYSNDIVRRDHTDVEVDMLTAWNPGMLLVLALQKHWPDDFISERDDGRGPYEWARDNKVAVLFHCSTPCDTYSTNGLSTHRISGATTPKTQKARDADAMNARLVRYFRQRVLEETAVHQS